MQCAVLRCPVALLSTDQSCWRLFNERPLGSPYQPSQLPVTCTVEDSAGGAPFSVMMGSQSVHCILNRLTFNSQDAIVILNHST